MLYGKTVSCTPTAEEATAALILARCSRFEQMFVSTKNAFDFPFCEPPPFEDQAANDAFELDFVRIGAQQFRIAMQYVEIGRCSARQTTHVAQPPVHGQTPADLHPVGVDDLKTVTAATVHSLVFVQDVFYIQILMLYAGQCIRTRNSTTLSSTLFASSRRMNSSVAGPVKYTSTCA